MTQHEKLTVTTVVLVANVGRVVVLTRVVNTFYSKTQMWALWWC